MYVSQRDRSGGAVAGEGWRWVRAAEDASKDDEEVAEEAAGILLEVFAMVQGYRMASTYY